MSKKRKVLIYKAGLNKNGCRIGENELSKCFDNNKKYPVFKNYNNKDLIGYMKDIEYIDGDLYANIIFFGDRIVLNTNIFRPAFLGNRKINKDKTYTLKDFKLEYGALVDKDLDALK